MVKAIEAAGLPVVHMCTVTPISMTVGANRIVPTIAIPHPLGNPALDKDEEYALRKSLVKKQRLINRQFLSKIVHFIKNMHFIFENYVLYCM